MNIAATTLPPLTATQRRLRRRLLTLSFDQGMSHLGSCLSMIDILWAIYQVKQPTDRVILSNGHAAFAWYVVLAELGLLTDAQLATAPTHPNAQLMPLLTASTGSLGQGLPIAIGVALAEPTQHVYCVISDGECTEGSIWEALRFLATHPLPNLTILVNANGWSAYDQVQLPQLETMLRGVGLPVRRCPGHRLSALQRALRSVEPQQTQLMWCQTTVDQLPTTHGQAAHYQPLTPAEYQAAMAQWPAKKALH